MLTKVYLTVAKGRTGLAGTVTLPAERPDRYHIYNQFVVRVPDRDRLKRQIAAGVGTKVYYPVPFHRQECFAEPGLQGGGSPARRAGAAEG